MRVAASIIALLALSTPVCAQSAQNATVSGATSSVNIVDPPAPANVNTTTRLTTPPTVVAPGLAAAGVETCLGSASGGLSLMGTGITFGSTVPDPGCSLRLTARQLFAFGFKAAAIALMCQDQRVAEAMATVGDACPSMQITPSAPPEMSRAPVDPPLKIVPRRKTVRAVKKRKPNKPNTTAGSLVLVMNFSAEEARWWLASAND